MNMGRNNEELIATLERFKAQGEEDLQSINARLAVLRGEGRNTDPHLAHNGRVITEQRPYGGDLPGF